MFFSRVNEGPPDQGSRIHASSAPVREQQRMQGRRRSGIRRKGREETNGGKLVQKEVARGVLGLVFPRPPVSHSLSSEVFSS